MLDPHINIEAVYNQATPQELEDGLSWYQRAHATTKFLADLYELRLKQVAGVVAVLSPGLRWEHNFKQAQQLISAWQYGDEIPMVGVYGRSNREKALKILEGSSIEIVSSSRALKVRAFEALLVEPTGHQVVVDRHAKCIAFGITEDRDKHAQVKAREYRLVEQAYKSLAVSMGLLASQLQAITWLTWRRLHGV